MLASYQESGHGLTLSNWISISIDIDIDSGEDCLGLRCLLGHASEFASLRSWLIHLGSQFQRLLTLDSNPLSEWAQTCKMSRDLLKKVHVIFLLTHFVTFPVSPYTIQSWSQTGRRIQTCLGTFLYEHKWDRVLQTDSTLAWFPGRAQHTLLGGGGPWHGGPPLNGRDVKNGPFHFVNFQNLKSSGISLI